jgi:hypothetical protein
MRVDPEKERAFDASLLAVLTNGLTDGKHVPFVEVVSNAEPRCPEVPNTTLCPGTDALGRNTSSNACVAPPT